MVATFRGLYGLTPSEITEDEYRQAAELVAEAIVAFLGNTELFADLEQATSTAAA